MENLPILVPLLVALVGLLTAGGFIQHRRMKAQIVALTDKTSKEAAKTATETEQIQQNVEIPADKFKIDRVETAAKVVEELFNKFLRQGEKLSETNELLEKANNEVAKSLKTIQGQQAVNDHLQKQNYTLIEINLGLREDFEQLRQDFEQFKAEHTDCMRQK